MTVCVARGACGVCACAACVLARRVRRACLHCIAAACARSGSPGWRCCRQRQRHKNGEIELLRIQGPKGPDRAGRERLREAGGTEVSEAAVRRARQGGADRLRARQAAAAPQLLNVPLCMRLALALPCAALRVARRREGGQGQPVPQPS